MVSRQREYQRRKQQEGKCIICGKKREKHKLYCNAHREQVRDQRREARLEKLEAGLCGHGACKKTPIEGMTLCPEHLARQRKCQAMMRMKE